MHTVKAKLSKPKTRSETLVLINAQVLVVDNNTKRVLTEGKEYNLKRHKENNTFEIIETGPSLNISIYLIAKKLL